MGLYTVSIPQVSTLLRLGWQLHSSTTVPHRPPLFDAEVLIVLQVCMRDWGGGQPTVGRL